MTSWYENCLEQLYFGEMQGVFEVQLPVHAQDDNTGTTFPFMLVRFWPPCDLANGGIDLDLGMPAFGNQLSSEVEALPLNLLVPINLAVVPHPVRPNQLVALHTDARFWESYK